MRSASRQLQAYTSRASSTGITSPFRMMTKAATAVASRPRTGMRVGMFGIRIGRTVPVLSEYTGNRPLTAAESRQASGRGSRSPVRDPLDKSR